MGRREAEKEMTHGVILDMHYPGSFSHISPGNNEDQGQDRGSIHSAPGTSNKKMHDLQEKSKRMRNQIQTDLLCFAFPLTLTLLNVSNTMLFPLPLSYPDQVLQLQKFLMTCKLHVHTHIIYMYI